MSQVGWRNSWAQYCRANPNAVALAILLLLSAAVHLPGLSYPGSVVFDEVFFGRFASAYCCNHEYFFDAHPPHAKLLIAGVASLLGYQGSLSFDHIGQSFGAISPMPLRLVPALAGTLLPLIVFQLLRQLGASRSAAAFGGLLIAFDNALTLHTRVISLDGVLLVATFGALCLYLASENAQTTRRRAILSFLTGCTIGFAVGTKFTGLAVAGLIGLCLLVRLCSRDGKTSVIRIIGDAGMLISGAALIYLIGWVLHFSLLTQRGPGDIWGQPTGNVVTDIVQIHGKLMSAHANLSQSHPYGSPWWSWPLMKRPIYFWNSPNSEAKMYSIGNPVVWWGGSLLFVVVLVNLALARVTNFRPQAVAEVRRPRFWLLIAGFVAAYAPLASVSRVLFMYHYFMPLIFSLMLVVLWLDHVGWMRGDDLLGQRTSYYVVIAALVTAFLLLTPLTYGLEGGKGVTNALFSVIPSWR